MTNAELGKELSAQLAASREPREEVIDPVWGIAVPVGEPTLDEPAQPAAHQTATDNEDDDPYCEFWNQRPILKHIRDFARSRRVAPFAVLACELRRAIACVPPNVKLPPLIGGATSVNLFTALDGVSGRGKGSADAAGFAAIYFPDPANPGEALDPRSPSLGTGEGLARMFKGRQDEDRLVRAHVMVPEVGSLAAVASRQGATIASQLLLAYMGEPLGFSNAHKETTTAVEAHSYRLCLGIGTQPENSAFFFDREKDGFPQRFLWVSATDPYAPAVRPTPVQAAEVLIPHFGDEEHLIAVPAGVAGEIDRHRYLTLTGSPDVDPLDGHLMLTRLKVAFGLALLDERRGITDEDWRVAGQLIALSTRVRAEARAAIEERRRRANRAKAHDEAERVAILSERAVEGAQKRVWDAVYRKLEREGRATRRELRHTVASACRDEFNPVLEMMVEQGVLTLTPGVSRSNDVFGIARG